MNKPTIKDVYAILRYAKRQIASDCLAFEDDEQPGIQITFACNADDWGWQTGDNSYTGGAYSFPEWPCVLGVYRDTDCRSMARDVVKELTEAMLELGAAQ
jgi:hypothetical protein